MQSVAAALARLGDLAASTTVSRLANAFAAAGHELALVGGPVRDAFLDRVTNDLDFTTDASPDQILKIVRPLADAHWDIGRAFGTIGAKVGDDTVEITTYRADSYDGQTRRPDVVFGASLEDDLIRRDFTVNALALRLPEVTLVDPAGGIDDMLAGILRTPAAPEVSFG
ncbi:MAG TPA: CCA tRNA nucleotidyltransferase, partial [Cryobacterium sp.]|nr:CCA tRNA nucleotidyltransferase [Cryobacterium sp.]